MTTIDDAKRIANFYGVAVTFRGETVHPDRPPPAPPKDHGLGDNVPRQYATPTGEGTKL